MVERATVLTRPSTAGGPASHRQKTIIRFQMISS
uniref:Uncharacterized protein n=1 Tax=Anguilla anguilla TaxID=7936 RepID=A0A0E9T3A6_ANGAN